MTIDSTLVTASAAAVGSLVGAAATIAAAWMTQRSQLIRGHTEWKLRERESLYGDFIKEASRLAVDAPDHSLAEPEKLVALYGTLGRIRLISGDQVLHEAEECCRQIFELYSQPNLTEAQVREALIAHRFGPVKRFSAACRTELLRSTPVDRFFPRAVMHLANRFFFGLFSAATASTSTGKLSAGRNAGRSSHGVQAVDR